MAKAAKHTPGPWSIRVASRGHYRDVGITAPGCTNVIAECFEEFVAKTDRRPEEALANATLIAAAPDMLDVLKTTRRNIVSLADAGLPGPMAEWLRVVDVAIAKATAPTAMER